MYLIHREIYKRLDLRICSFWPWIYIFVITWTSGKWLL